MHIDVYVFLRCKAALPDKVSSVPKQTQQTANIAFVLKCYEAVMKSVIAAVFKYHHTML